MLSTEILSYRSGFRFLIKTKICIANARDVLPDPTVFMRYEKIIVNAILL